MISIIGIGSGASKIADKFSDKPPYNVYFLNENVKRKTKRKFKLQRFPEPEDYEDNIPDLEKFFAEVDDHAQVFIIGSSYSSNYSLGILEQLRDKKVDVFYIKPDIELLTGIPKLIENVTYGVLQQYARSGLFNSLTIISNLSIEKHIQNISIKNYYEALNQTIFSAVHYLNFFLHTEPEIGQPARPAEVNRIRAMGMLNMKNMQEKWLFALDNMRDVCYYLCINEEEIRKGKRPSSAYSRYAKGQAAQRVSEEFRMLYMKLHYQTLGFALPTLTQYNNKISLDKLVQE